MNLDTSVAISPAEIEFEAWSVADTAGRVFRWNGNVFRALRQGSTGGEVDQAFSTGLVNHLQAMGFVPKSRMTNYSLEGFDAVVWHDEVRPLTYPYEWTFEMLRDAALFVLELAAECTKLGWALKDSHAYNVVFQRNRPLWLDFGSFVRSDSKSSPSPIPFGEFRVSYYWPLLFWSRGFEYIARRILSDGCGFIPEETAKRLLETSSKNTNIGTVYRLNSLLRRLLNGTAISRRGSTHSSNTVGCSAAPLEALDQMRETVRRIPKPSTATEWKNYHGDYIQSGVFVPTARFERIAEIVRKLDVGSAIDIGANQGLFSKYLLSLSNLTSIIAMDTDWAALESLYEATKSDGRPDSLMSPSKKEIVIVRQNAVIPETNVYSKLPYERMRSDLVVALAVTHHMILGAGLSIEHVLNWLSFYTRRFALIEFMPLGLWDGKTAPSVPATYTIDHFRLAFERRFKLLGCEQLEANRILLWGEVSANS